MERRDRAWAIVKQMTLEEKASLCSGKNFWVLKGIERLGLPEIMMTDGPHGLRKQVASADHLGINDSVPATCFPTASATGCSFDRALLAEVGRAMGEECRQEDVAVILGPGLNIKRSPLCGRNFEYFSEDPFLSGELGAAMIGGVQSQGVGVSVKHFAANNQETRRMTSDSVVDERALREIYLSGFERAVKQGDPWTVMCSYNRLEGVFCSEHPRLLTEILREEWGFDGLVVSDWGAVNDRPAGVAAGLDLEMPNVGLENDRAIVEAARAGRLSVSAIDSAALRVTELILRACERKKMQYDVDAHHALARRAAAESAVLLKNEKGLLPGRGSAAVIGAFAKKARYQGAGSSKINPHKIDSAFDELLALGVDAVYAEGYPLETDAPDERMIEEAVEAARGKDVAYVFAGLPDRYESEGFDREKLTLPESHVRLIEAVAEANPNTAVILMGGGAMEIPWADRVAAILSVALGGEAVGGACADILTGRVNPSGKLAETWAYALEDAPSRAYFPGFSKSVEYRESLFVGYRYFDTADLTVRFPFGHGLSYTSFAYADLRADAHQVTFAIENTGDAAGAEVAQVYVAKKGSAILRAAQELKGFEKVCLEPGEKREITIALDDRAFAHYDVKVADWRVEPGAYEIRVGSSSRDIRLTQTITLEGSGEVEPQIIPESYRSIRGMRVTDEDFVALLGRPLPPRERVEGEPFTINSTMADIQGEFIGRLLLRVMRAKLSKLDDGGEDIRAMADRMFMDIPLRTLLLGSGGKISYGKLMGMVDMLNGRRLSGMRKLLAK